MRLSNSHSPLRETSSSLWHTQCRQVKSG